MSATPWYKPNGVLTPEKHERLVANRENYARDAGIPVELIWKALPALSEGVAGPFQATSLRGLLWASDHG
jgi:hypothetical protein